MNDLIRLEKDFSFDSAHRLVGYKGNCSNLHGHQWGGRIVVKGTEQELDKTGMLWDFTGAKLIKNKFDHKTILKNCEENHLLIHALMETSGFESVYLMENKNPTAENLCLEILSELIKSYPQLSFEVTLWETPESKCEVKK